MHIFTNQSTTLGLLRFVGSVTTSTQELVHRGTKSLKIVPKNLVSQIFICLKILCIRLLFFILSRLFSQMFKKRPYQIGECKSVCVILRPLSPPKQSEQTVGNEHWYHFKKTPGLNGQNNVKMNPNGSQCVK